MGMFLPDDQFYDETRRQVGFSRYKQLLGRHWPDWLKLNALTLIGAVPLVFAILLAIASESTLILIPGSLLGGMVFGPFLSGLYDGLLRAFRDDPLPWWDNYRKSWKQNLRCSLIPGALLGLAAGIYSFMGMLLWWAQRSPSLGTVLLMLFSLLLTTAAFLLYWVQLVLFQQSPGIRLRNALLFALQNFWRVFGVGLIQILFLAVYLLFAPWTLLILPVVGIWYVLFLSLHLLYPALDEAFRIEEQFNMTQT